MSLLKRKQELLNCVQSDNVLKFLYLMHIQSYRALIDMTLKGTTLLHEVTSAEMLTLLLLYSVNVRIPNQERKTAIHAYKKRLKALQKERKALLQKKDAQKRIEKLGKKIKKQLEAIKLLSLNNRNLFLKEGVVHNPYPSGECPYLKNLRQEGVFFEQDKRSGYFFENLVNYLTHYCVEKIKQVNKTNTLLKMGGFKKEKTHLSYRLVQNNPQARMLYQQDENGGPLLLFRGTTNSNDPFESLSHFGTLKAARDRLDKLDELRNIPKSNFCQNMKLGKWQLVFQIKPVYLKMKNPLRIPDISKHDLNNYKNVLIHFLLQENYGRFFITRMYMFSLEYFSNQLEKAILPKEYDFVFMQPYSLTTQQVKKELFLGGLYPVLSEKMDPSAQSKNLKNLMFQRFIRFFERRGYDGFVYKNGWEDAGNDSFITFRKEQVVLASQIDKKRLISPIQIPHEKELLKLENRYLSSCKEYSLKDNKIIDCGYKPLFFKGISSQYSYEFIAGCVHNPLFAKEFGVQIFPQKIKESVAHIKALINAKYMQKFYSK